MEDNFKLKVTARRTVTLDSTDIAENTSAMSRKSKEGKSHSHSGIKDKMHML